MAVKAIAPRAWGSLATAPGSNEALYCAGGAAGFRIWRAARGWHWRISRNGRGFPYLMEFPEFARRPPGTEGQWKPAVVNLARWESTRANTGGVTLPRPLSLSDFEPKLFIRRASAARPIRPAPAADFFLATFLFSDSAVPATHGRQGDRAASLGVAGNSTRLERGALLRWWRRWFSDLACRPRVALEDQQKRARFSLFDGIPGICSPATGH